MLGHGRTRGVSSKRDTQYLEAVGKERFYGFLAGLRGPLFRDEEFAHLYAQNSGRPSVGPSLLATALLLQHYDRVSDEVAKVAVTRNRGCFPKTGFTIGSILAAMHKLNQCVFPLDVEFRFQREGHTDKSLH